MRILTLFSAAVAVVMSSADDSIVVQLQPSPSGQVLEWRAQVKKPFAGMQSQYQIEWSADLSQWQTFGDPITGEIGADDELLRRIVTVPHPNAFYRVNAQALVVAGESFPDAQYGYASEFTRNLHQVGLIPLNEFARRYTPTTPYRESISFDPTTSLHWNEFNVDPAVYNSTNTTTPRQSDFRLNEQELAVFKKNGFVVSQRLGAYSFADALYRIYVNDLPVYVSSDALLQAWHRSFVLMLAEIEESYLLPALTSLVDNMNNQIGALAAEAGGTPLQKGVLDADYFLAVAKSLLSGTNYSGQLGQGDHVTQALAAISALEARQFELFGAERWTDFSQFKVRGHYEQTPQLKNYFRAMMWCGIIDFRFQSAANVQSLREFSGAVALNLLLDRAGERDNWLKIDNTVRTFVGLPDALNLSQLGDLITAANLQPPFANLADTYASLWTGDLGVQNIRSGYFESPLSAAQIQLPRSFALMPQRFTLDSWALSKVVFDDIIWDENGIPELEDKVLRRIPSSLDVAFAVLGNDSVVPDIAARIANTGRQWRDGLPYQHNLAALRMSVDAHAPSYWGSSIYAAWIHALRTLSKPTTGPEFPQALQTRAWAMNSLNTQLASWTQLRHDTVLYVKQSYTGWMGCLYPEAYVEPRPDFWQALADMAAVARAAVDLLPSTGETTVRWNQYSNAAIKTNRLQLFDRFAAAALTLKGISIKQLQRAELNAEEIVFLQDIVEQQKIYEGRTYNGWYPQLFYRPIYWRTPYVWNEGADMWDALVTDVHTDVPDEYTGDPGCVLHQGVGNVHMLFIAVDCGDGPPKMFAGPVLSHYEFETSINNRKTDSEWQTDIKEGKLPPSPEWTKSYLVPGPYKVPWFP